MLSTYIQKENLENILQSNWANFLDKKLLMLRILKDARDSDYPKIKQKEIPAKQIKLTVTKITIDKQIEVWVEFSVPKENSVSIGTHVYNLYLNGELELIQTYGTDFIT